MRPALFPLMCVASALMFGSSEKTEATVDKTPHRLTVNATDFLLDGEPIQIISGEMHYQRVPREYWKDRLERIKAMGCNTVCTYIFWNMHEPRPGEWNFKGNLDIAEYCRIAQEVGLWVIIRPGPYVCAEWEFGGFPAWLLKDREMVVRSNSPAYMAHVREYLKKVSEQLAPLQASKGGPIIMAQVENEYGAYSNDKEYLKAHEEAMKEGGLDEVQLFTADQPTRGCLTNGTLPHLPATLTFGGGAENAFKTLRELRPEGPRMNSEFWCGWFDHWGAVHNPRSTEAYNREFKWMIENGISVNFYMIHGGTSFGFMAGANGGHNKMTPDITSYDYSAPISESGKLTDRYYAFRKTVEEVLRKELPPPPADNPVISIDPVSFDLQAGMFDALPQAVLSDKPLNMEELDQAYGFMLYRTTIEGTLTDAPLKMTRLMDRAIVFVDGKRVGTADRRHGQDTVKITTGEGRHQLDILVENMGRVNYGGAIPTERKGITDSVTLNGQELTQIQHFSLPCDDSWVRGLGYAATAPSSEQPVFYKAEFSLDKTADTFLDMQDGWTKGVVWVNGHNLGRFWFVGPQQTLYCPAPFLNKGRNEIIVLDLEGGSGTVKGVPGQVWVTHKEKNIHKLNRKEGQTIEPSKDKLIHNSTFEPGETWQEIAFDKTHEGRFIAIESLNAHDNQNYAAIAELDILDDKGQLLKKEEWKIAYADSEEVDREQGNADLVMDKQPVTFWHTEWSERKPPHPHLIIIDLGGQRKVSGFRYLPRPGASGGRIKDYNVYLSPEAFPDKQGS